MRLKCETYSTLSDSDEDTDAEDRWQLKVTNASGFSPHNVPYISPAALYLTAIIECVHSSPRVDHVLIFGACEFPGLFASKRLNTPHYHLSAYQIFISIRSLDIFCPTLVELQPGIAAGLPHHCKTSTPHCVKMKLYMDCSKT